MASVRGAYSWPPAHLPETKLQLRRVSCSSGGTMPINNEIVDTGIDDEAIEAEQHHVVAV